MELASKFMESLKALKITDADALRITRSKIDAKELQDDLPQAPAVTLKEFDELLTSIARSRTAIEDAAKPEPKAAAKPQAAPEPDGFFDVEAVTEIGDTLKAHVARSEKRTDAMAQGQIGALSILEKLTHAVTKLSEQIASQGVRQDGQIAEIQRSLASRVPAGPRAVTGQVSAAASPNDEQPSKVDVRRKVDAALKVAIARSQGEIREATDSTRGPLVRRMQELSRAAALLGTGHDPAECAKMAGLDINDMKAA